VSSGRRCSSSSQSVLRSGEIPANRVDRYGGHDDVNQVLSRTLGVESRTNVGFVAVMKGDGSFGFRWTSRSINGRNPAFGHRGGSMGAAR
jgi:hypothetical protein